MLFFQHFKCLYLILSHCDLDNTITEMTVKFIFHLLLKFDKLVFDGREHLFINAVGSHLQTHIQDLTHKIEDLQRQLNSQANSYGAKIKEWRDNHKQLTTAYNELHYEYRQFKKSVNEKEMDNTEEKVEEVG